MRHAFWRADEMAPTFKLRLLYLGLGFTNIIDGIFLVFTFGHFHFCATERILGKIIKRRFDFNSDNK